MAGFTTQATTMKTTITFNTSTGKKKSFSFGHAEDYDPDLMTRLRTIGQAFIDNTIATKDADLLNIDNVSHTKVTKTTFSKKEDLS